MKKGYSKKWKTEFCDGAEMLIRNSGHPLTICDLFDIYSRFGKKIWSKEMIKGLSEDLLKDDRFVGIEKTVPGGKPVRLFPGRHYVSQTVFFDLKEFSNDSDKRTTDLMNFLINSNRDKDTKKIKANQKVVCAKTVPKRRIIKAKGLIYPIFHMYLASTFRDKPFTVESALYYMPYDLVIKILHINDKSNILNRYPMMRHVIFGCFPREPFEYSVCFAVLRQLILKLHLKYNEIIQMPKGEYHLRNGPILVDLFNNYMIRCDLLFNEGILLFWRIKMIIDMMITDILALDHWICCFSYGSTLKHLPTWIPSILKYSYTISLDPDDFVRKLGMEYIFVERTIAQQDNTNSIINKLSEFFSTKTLLLSEEAFSPEGFCFLFNEYDYFGPNIAINSISQSFISRFGFFCDVKINWESIYGKISNVTEYSSSNILKKTHYNRIRQNNEYVSAFKHCVAYNLFCACELSNKLLSSDQVEIMETSFIRMKQPWIISNRLSSYMSILLVRLIQFFRYSISYYYNGFPDSFLYFDINHIQKMTYYLFLIGCIKSKTFTNEIGFQWDSKRYPRFCHNTNYLEAFNTICDIMDYSYYHSTNYCSRSNSSIIVFNFPNISVEATAERLKSLPFENEEPDFLEYKIVTFFLPFLNNFEIPHVPEEITNPIPISQFDIISHMNEFSRIISHIINDYGKKLESHKHLIFLIYYIISVSGSEGISFNDLIETFCNTNDYYVLIMNIIELLDTFLFIHVLPSFKFSLQIVSSYVACYKKSSVFHDLYDKIDDQYLNCVYLDLYQLILFNPGLEFLEIGQKFRIIPPIDLIKILSIMEYDEIIFFIEDVEHSSITESYSELIHMPNYSFLFEIFLFINNPKHIRVKRRYYPTKNSEKNLVYLKI